MRTRWLYRSVDTAEVLNNLSYMLRLYGIVSVPPAAVSLAFGEHLYAALFAGIGLAAFVAGTLRYRESRASVSNAESFVIVALSYVLFSLLGACAFLPVSPFLDGFFESMSGFTTTGLTMFDPGRLPRSLVFFRSYAQWIGGAGIVILSSVILRIPARTAYRITLVESARAGLIGSMRSVAALILKVYLILTGIGYIALVAAGMDRFDATVHALSAISTGGFSSRAGSAGAFGGTAAMAVLIAVMALGAVNFPLYHHLGKTGERRRFCRDPQLRLLVVLVAAFAGAGLIAGGGKGPLDSLFHSATSLTTTGFSLRPVRDWSEPMKLLASIQMVVGGGDGSTAGGIKLFRLIVMLRIAGWFIRRSLLPARAKTPVRYGERIMSNRELKEIFAFLSLYLVILCLSTAALALGGHPAADSFFESASSLGTVGLSSGITAGSMPFGYKLLLIFNMWAGRIEILPVLVLFNPLIWNLRRNMP